MSTPTARMAYPGDYTNTSIPTANMNNNPEQQAGEPLEHPMVVGVGDGNSDASRHSRRRSSHVQVSGGRHEAPHVERMEERHHHYTYIPSTSSFSRQHTPPPSGPTVIIQPPPDRYLQTPHVDNPFIPKRQFYGKQTAFDYQPYQSHNAPNGIYLPLPATWPPASLPGQPQPSYHTPEIYLQKPDYEPSYDHGHASAESASQEAASTYVAVDPFRPSGRSSIISSSLPVAQGYQDHPSSSTPHYVVYPYTRRRTVCFALLVDFFAMVFTFLLDTLPRQFYLNFLLRLPAFYFSRVARIFEEAEMTMPEIEQMALHGMDPIALQQLPWSSPAGANLKSTWEGFIDSLLREWKTLNIISVLLLSAILTVLQIDGAATDPVARNAALFSLICALMSLLYGCMYIIRFSSMRKAYKALEWAQEAQKTKTLIWWNVWVLLAMPAAWLAWSIMLYVSCIMAFVWRADTTGLDPSPTLSPQAELSIRIAISVVLGLGVLYFALIMNTLRQYGDSMDKKFKAELEKRVWEKRAERRYGHGSHGSNPWVLDNHSRSRNSPNPYADHPAYATPYFPPPPRPNTFDTPPGAYDAASFFKTVKIMDLQFHQRGGYPMPDFLLKRDFKHEDWEKFISEELLAWDGDVPLFRSRPFGSAIGAVTRPQDSAARVLARWNRKYFNRRKTMALLCHEYLDFAPHSPTFALYLVDISSADGQPVLIADRFGPVPEGMTRVDIFDQPGRERSRRRILGRTSIFSSQNPIDGRVHFGGQVHALSPERRPRSSSSYSSSRSHSRSPSRSTGSRPSRRPRSQGRETSHVPRRRRSRSYSPGRSRPHGWPPYYIPPTPYNPWPVPRENAIVMTRTPSSSPSRRTSPPPLQHTGPEPRAVPRPKSKNDTFKSSGTAIDEQRPVTPRTKSRRSTVKTQTTTSELDLLVFPPPLTPWLTRPHDGDTKADIPPPSPPHEDIVVGLEAGRRRHPDTGGDVPPPARKLLRSSPGADAHPSDPSRSAPLIVPHPRHEPSAAHADAKAHGPLPASKEAPDGASRRSASSQSFRSFSRSRSRSTSSSRSVLPARAPPSAMYDERAPNTKASFGIQVQEHARYDKELPGHHTVHGRGRERERRGRRTIDPGQRQSKVAQFPSTTSIQRNPDAEDAQNSTKVPSSLPALEAGTMLDPGLLSESGSGGVDYGPWLRDRSSLLRTISQPL